MEGQQSLFSVPVDVRPSALGQRRRPARSRMVEIQCPRCGGLFMSFVHGVRCDDCRKAKAETAPAEPRKVGQVSAYGWVDAFPPGF